MTKKIDSKSEIKSGLAVFFSAIPLILAFGFLTGLGTSSALLGFASICLFTFILGYNDNKIYNLTASVSALSLVLLVSFETSYHNNLEAIKPLIFISFIFTGVIQFLLSFTKASYYFQFIPNAVIDGLTKSIGFAIILWQFLPLFGYSPVDDSNLINQFYPQAEEIILNNILKEQSSSEILVLEDFQGTIKRAADITIEEINEVAKILAKNYSMGIRGSTQLFFDKALLGLNVASFFLGILTLLLSFSIKKVNKNLPHILIALIATTIIAHLFFSGYATLEKITLLTEIKGYPTKNWMVTLQSLVIPNFLSIISFSVLVYFVSVRIYNADVEISSLNQNIKGLGVGNIFTSLLGGLIGSFSYSQSLINSKKQVKSKKSRLILFLCSIPLVILLSLFIEYIPISAIASVLIIVGIDLIKNKKEFLASKFDFAIMILTTITCFVGIALLNPIIISAAIIANTTIHLVANPKNNENYVSGFIDMPKELVIPIQQYLVFFNEYVAATKNAKIDFEVYKIDNGLRIKLKENTKYPISKIKKWFDEYIDLIRSNKENFVINIENKNNINNDKIDIIRLKLENQISNLKNSLKIASLENKFLKDENNFLRSLTLNFSEREVQIINSNSNKYGAKIKKSNQIMKIENQNIYGGNQQFADTIINNSPFLSNTDKRFIELIHNNTEDEDERNKLIHQLEIVNSEQSSKAKKKEAGGLLKIFIDTGVSESSKILVKEIIEQGGELVQFLV